MGVARESAFPDASIQWARPEAASLERQNWAHSGPLNEVHGAPGEIRTPGLLVRSQTLYPTELRARGEAHSMDTRQGEQGRRPRLRGMRASSAASPLGVGPGRRPDHCPAGGRGGVPSYRHQQPGASPSCRSCALLSRVYGTPCAGLSFLQCGVSLVIAAQQFVGAGYFAFPYGAW